MRSKPIVTLVVAALLAVVGSLVFHSSAGAATTATSATSSAADSGTRTLQFHVVFSPFELVDVGAPGFSIGDEVVFHDQLYAGSRHVGDELGSCVVVDAAVALANCTMVIRLPRGSIAASFPNSPPPTKHLAITGGTGGFGSVDGQGTLVEHGDGTGTLTLHVSS